MARNYDIAEFNATDALDPAATRKLNHNFRRTLDLINEIQVGGIDTGAIAAFVIDEIDDDIISLQGTAENHEERIDALEQGGGGGGGSVTGVKGDVEQDYNTGDVSIGLKETGYAMHSSFVSDLWNGTAEPDQDDLPD